MIGQGEIELALETLRLSHSLEYRTRTPGALAFDEVLRREGVDPDGLAAAVRPEAEVYLSTDFPPEWLPAAALMHGFVAGLVAARQARDVAGAENAGERGQG